MQAWNPYVLRALGRSDELAHSSIRFSVGRFTTRQDIGFAVNLLNEQVAPKMSPLWKCTKRELIWIPYSGQHISSKN